jgi:hypothetical protein
MMKLVGDILKIYDNVCNSHLVVGI